MPRQVPSTWGENVKTIAGLIAAVLMAAGLSLATTSTASAAQYPYSVDT